MATTSYITQRVFGYMASGDVIEEYTLTNRTGATLKVLTLGAIVREINVPNRQGQLTNVNLGFDSLAPYITDSPFFGALVGRFGNRIANASFTLDGVVHQLAANNGTNNLHAGPVGFDKLVWGATPIEDARGPALQLNLISAHGDQGFPGELTVTVTYIWTHESRWIIEYEAHTDLPTPVNLTQHAYFNLAGNGNVLEQYLQLNAAQFTPLDEKQIPICAGVSVADTPFDFRVAKPIGRDITSEHPQIRIGSGYDHNFVLPEHDRDTLVTLGEAYALCTGIRMQVFTTEPGVQLYTANFLDDSIGNASRRFEPYAGFCLETQHLPDSPNRDDFPSTILRPGEVYRTRTEYAFSLLAD